MTNDQRRAGEMKLVPVDPPEAMWGGLARQIVMWCRFGQPTGKALFQHLKSGGYEIPAWLREEVDDIDHVPPKGTVAVCIYRAMLDASPLPDGGGDRTGAGSPGEESEWRDRSLTSAERLIVFAYYHAYELGQLLKEELLWIADKWKSETAALSPGSGSGQRETSVAAGEALSALAEPSWVDRAAWCAEQILPLLPVEFGEGRSDCGTTIPHLRWMARQLAQRQLTSETKACRWLGYLQAGAIFRGVTTLDAEKERNLASAKVPPSVPSPPPGQAVSQSIAGEDDLRAKIQSAFKAWGYPAYSTVMEGFEAGYRAALARSPAAGAGQECENCGSRDSIETIRAAGYLSCCPERSMKPVAALAPAPSPQVERVRHVKRGTEYEVLGEAEAQVSEGMKRYGMPGGTRLISDGSPITVYRCLKTGKLWCRFTDEFRDGRFLTLENGEDRHG